MLALPWLPYFIGWLENKKVKKEKRQNSFLFFMVIIMYKV